MRIGLFGLPGAGKGTQAALMAKRWALPHISTGDMFRDLEKGCSPLAKEIRGILASGALVSDELVTNLVCERLSQNDCRNGFILDGYPRTLAQAKALQSSQFALDCLMAIDISHQEIIKRLSGRRVCERCKSVYGSYEIESLNDLKCPKDGGSLIQRADDLPDAIATRLKVFEKNFEPVLDFYRELGLLRHVDGFGPLDLVFERISDLLRASKVA